MMNKEKITYWDIIKITIAIIISLPIAILGSIFRKKDELHW